MPSHYEVILDSLKRFTGAFFSTFILSVTLHLKFKSVFYTLKKKIFALCSISLIKMSSYNITLGKNGPNLILLNINNVIKKKFGLHIFSVNKNIFRSS